MYDARTFEEIDIDSRYDDTLDTNYMEVVIVGVTFSPSAILKNCDPVAYRTSRNDWADSMTADGVFIEELPEDE